MSRSFLRLAARRSFLSGLVAALICSTVCSAVEVTVVELPNGKSPDGTFYLRVRKRPKSGEATSMELVATATGKVAATATVGGYAGSALAEANTAAVVWSPDSRKFALMTRDTKRSTNTRVFRADASGLREIDLPSATDAAFKLLGAKESYRCVFQRPTRWLNTDTLLIQVSGDIVKETGDKVPVWYEVDVIYKLSEKKVLDSKLISTKPREG